LVLDDDIFEKLELIIHFYSSLIQ